MHISNKSFNLKDFERLKEICKNLNTKHHFVVPNKFCKEIKEHFKEDKNIIITNGGDIKDTLYLKL